MDFSLRMIPLTPISHFFWRKSFSKKNHAEISRTELAYRTLFVINGCDCKPPENK